ncbi:hypothetical protein N7G274_008654 [Stereocaulon virgatum]|uniref:C2H2-type domain-containing protein n=1 Tax=Stereocaulon virgatum TaxID=373712 RepID=A0ABR4A005_9LECA
MSEYVPVSDQLLQDLTNGKDDWDPTMSDLNDDSIDWSEFFGSDAQGRVDPDFGKWDRNSPIPLNEPTNEASHHDYDTNLLTTESETVPSHDTGTLDSKDSLVDAGVPKSSSEDETWFGIKDTPCKCIVCLDLTGSKNLIVIKGVEGVHKYFCRFPACPMILKQCVVGDARFIIWHEQDHFVHEDRFICAETHCSYSTTCWADLKRLYTGRHCMNPQRFPCPEFGCKYSGENGFTRNDKLKRHHQTVHEGKIKPGKPFQAIQPKTGSAA